MTIQVGACCANRTFVLAGDTKVRTNERRLSERELTTTAIHQSKIVFGEHHGIAVAMAGDEGSEINAARELADYLSSLNPLPDFLGPALREWGDEYFIKQYPGLSENFAYAPCLFLVVNPQSEFCPLLKLRVNRKSSEQASSRTLVNGHDSNPAVFWLEYTKALDKSTEMSLEDVTGSAITTVLAAGVLNGFGIGGLEVHQYENGKWANWGRAEIERVEENFKHAEDEIKTKVRHLGIRPVTPIPSLALPPGVVK